MTTLDQMAQVLEDAAQMYQDEKDNWCSDSWYKDHNGDCDGSNLKPGSPLSVCASTALGMAAGLGVLVPEFLEDNAMLGGPDKGTTEDEHWGWAYVWTEEAVQRYKDTRAWVEGRLEERYGVAYLPEFNDAAERAVDEFGNRVPLRTKQEIIDLFKDTAKELRNGDDQG
jgi:hypothetical protein